MVDGPPLRTNLVDPLGPDAAARTLHSVLFLHPSDEAYGSDRVLLDLAVGLTDRGWRAVVLLSDDQPEGWLTHELCSRGIETRRGPLAPARRRSMTFARLPSYVRRLLRARRWIRDEARRARADIIHVNTSALLVGAILGRPGGARLVWHVHEIVVRPHLLGWIFRLVPVLTADRVVAVSRAVKDHLSPGGLGKRRITVVWNGIQDRPALPLPSDHDGPAVAFIGRLNRWKGWEVFVDAVGIVAPAFPTARFVVAGDPPPGEEWRIAALRERLSRAGLQDRIDVLGFEPDIETLLSKVDIVAVPSLWPEPFGLVTLEAMQAGRAVVASAHGGTLDLIESGCSGLLVPPGDAAALGSAFTALLRDAALRARLGAAARKRAEARFTLQRFVEEMERVYLALDFSSPSDDVPGPLVVT